MAHKPKRTSHVMELLNAGVESAKKEASSEVGEAEKRKQDEQTGEKVLNEVNRGETEKLTDAQAGESAETGESAEASKLRAELEAKRDKYGGAALAAETIENILKLAEETGSYTDPEAYEAAMAQMNAVEAAKAEAEQEAAAGETEQRGADQEIVYAPKPEGWEEMAAGGNLDINSPESTKTDYNMRRAELIGLAQELGWSQEQLDKQLAIFDKKVAEKTKVNPEAEFASAGDEEATDEEIAAAAAVEDERREAGRKSEYYARLAKMAQETKPGAWMSEEERAEYFKLEPGERERTVNKLSQKVKGRKGFRRVVVKTVAGLAAALFMTTVFVGIGRGMRGGPDRIDPAAVKTEASLEADSYMPGVVMNAMSSDVEVAADQQGAETPVVNLDGMNLGAGLGLTPEDFDFGNEVDLRDQDEKLVELGDAVYVKYGFAEMENSHELSNGLRYNYNHYAESKRVNGERSQHFSESMIWIYDLPAAERKQAFVDATTELAMSQPEVLASYVSSMPNLLRQCDLPAEVVGIQDMAERSNAILDLMLGENGGDLQKKLVGAYYAAISSESTQLEFYLENGTESTPYMQLKDAALGMVPGNFIVRTDIKDRDNAKQVQGVVTYADGTQDTIDDNLECGQPNGDQSRRPRAVIISVQEQMPEQKTEQVIEEQTEVVQEQETIPNVIPLVEPLIIPEETPEEGLEEKPDRERPEKETEKETEEETTSPEDETKPDETKPEESTPEETTPEETTPEETTPEETTPEETTPEETTPEETTPEETSPDETTPGETTPEETTPEETTPEETTPEETTPEETKPEETEESIKPKDEEEEKERVEEGGQTGTVTQTPNIDDLRSDGNGEGQGEAGNESQGAGAGQGESESGATSGRTEGTYDVTSESSATPDAGNQERTEQGAVGDNTQNEEEQREAERNQSEANENERTDSVTDDEFADIIEAILGTQ